MIQLKVLEQILSNNLIYDFDKTSFFKSFISPNSICNYFLTNAKRYPGIWTEIRRIVCIKLILRLKRDIFITNWIKFHDQTFTSDCISILLNTRSIFDCYVFKPTLPCLYDIERNSYIKFRCNIQRHLL